MVSSTAIALALLTALTTATQPTSAANLFLAHLDQHPLLDHDHNHHSVPTSPCLTTKTGAPVTITSGVSDPTTSIRTYALTTQAQTLIHACSARHTGPLSAPQTTTQILHRTISYAEEASRTPSVQTTSITNTWAQFPAAASVATSNKQLGTKCECPSSSTGWRPDKRCVERGLKTGCSVQCGFFRGRFTCLVGSDNPKEFFEGRVCFGEGTLEYLGEPCHVGDVMMHCDECE